MPSPGQHHKDEGREPTLTPAIPGEGVYEVEFKNIRTNVVRLLPNGFQERKLKKLGNTSAKSEKLINGEKIITCNRFNEIEE
ncbi:MAG: RNA-guided endonuclease TnpB family protein, partial [Thermoprotei archaeon]